MSQQLVNQITLDCLLNKELMGEHIIKQREKQINKEEFKLYKKRIFELFRDMINGQSKDVSPDIKYAYNTFIKTVINHLKDIDTHELLQAEYRDIDIPQIEDTEEEELTSLEDANKLMMRSIKIETPTLDKYVKKTKKTNSEIIIIPKQRGIDKIKNVDNIYENKGPDEKNT